MGISVNSPFANPVWMEFFAPWLVDPLVGVGPEIVALSLQQVCRKPTATIAVKVG